MPDTESTRLPQEVEALVRRLVEDVLTTSPQLGEECANDQRGAWADTAPQEGVREERVDVSSAFALSSFVERILVLSKDHAFVKAFRKGKWRFVPDTSPTTTMSPANGHTSIEKVSFSKGLIGEQQVDALPDGCELHLGKRVQLTPLARDRLRQKNIAVIRPR